MNAEAVALLVRHHLPAAASGDRDAYGRIVAASQNAITAIALAITRDVPASEDIAQEVPLPRVLARRHALEARRDPEDAARRRRRERIEAWVGITLGLGGGLGGLLYGLIASGRL